MRLLIVDREPSMRTELAQLCLGAADLQVVGEADSGGAAIDAAQSLSPDVMLIDVALPDMSGFDLLRGAGDPGPLGIMTSHQPDFAERALAEGAVDYLIKPVRADRFEHAIARVRQRYILERAAQAQLTREILELLGRRPKILVGERQHRLYPLDVEKIEYIEADGNYVTIRAANQEYISRDTIKRLSVELASFGFVRIDQVDTIEYSGGPVCGASRSRNAGLHSIFRNVSALQQDVPRRDTRRFAVASLSRGSASVIGHARAAESLR